MTSSILRMIRAAMRAAGLAAALALPVGTTAAAPLPPFKPVDLCGTIVAQEWQPELRVPALPSASGTLGRDRTWPARFRVVLERYSGIDAATARRLNGHLGFSPADAGGTAAAPARVLLLLPHDDRRHLDGATALCVEGFWLWGDEGGTWTRYRSLSVTR